MKLVEKSNVSSSSNSPIHLSTASTYHVIYVSMYRYILDPVQTHDTQANTHMRTHTHTHTHMRTHRHTHRHTRIHTQTQTQTQTHRLISINTYT